MSSRRKQGRPQQRKILDSLEQENDLLVCGDCQTSFPLQDIVQFIKHKNHNCNKENVETGCCPSADDGSRDDGEGPKDLSNPKSLASRKDGGGSDWIHSDRGTSNSRDGGSSVEMKEEGREQRFPLRLKQVVDAEANTTHSEPSKFVCEACRVTLSSAWALLQHAQKEHGMKIYNVSASISSSPSSLQPSPQPQPAHTRSHSHALPAHSSTPEMNTPSPRPSGDHRTPPSSVGSGGPSSPYHGPLNPFTPFRMPLDGRLPPSPFSRPPELQLPMDILEHYRLRPPHLVGTVGVAIPQNMEPHFAHAAFDRTRPMSTLESQIYSQRLKQLANTTLPPGLISPLPGAPFTPPVLTPLQPSARESRGGRDSVGSGRESTGSLDHNRDREEKEKVLSQEGFSPPSRPSSALSAQLPNKLKSCEFCGKMFRFQSNLIVHRRSHTGEKPFKCSLCPHACTQQSKLKRHMKTHSVHSGARNASLTSTTASSDGSVHSTSSTPDSTRHKLDDAYGLDDDDDDDDLDDDEDEDEEEDMEGDFTDGDYESGAEGDSNDAGSVKAEAEGRPGDLHSPSQAGTPDNDRAPTPTKRSASASLVSEVMKHSGLNCIQPYNEAFQAALAEKFSKEKAHDLSLKENGDGENENNYKRTGSGLFLGKTDLLGNKSIKHEPGELGAQETGSAASIFSRTGFARWLPPDGPSSHLRAFFPGFPPSFALQSPEFSRDSHNGFSPGSLVASDSALKVPSSMSGLTSISKPGTSSSLLAASNGSSVIPRKDSRRNDTCEFCGKVFKNCSNLTVHRRSHTGEKPYKCSLCNYACAQSSKLTRHMKTHGRIGKDVFKCKFCNMPFSVPSTLEKHMRKCVESRNARILADQVNAHGMDSSLSMMDQENSNNSSSAPSLQGLSTPVAAGDEEPMVLALDKSADARASDKSPLDAQSLPMALTMDKSSSDASATVTVDKSPQNASPMETRSHEKSSHNKEVDKLAIKQERADGHGIGVKRENLERHADGIKPDWSY